MGTDLIPYREFIARSAAERNREALEAAEAADNFHANCDACGGEIAPEACAQCFPLADDARQKRRTALSAAPGKSFARPADTRPHPPRETPSAREQALEAVLLVMRTQLVKDLECTATLENGTFAGAVCRDMIERIDTLLAGREADKALEGVTLSPVLDFHREILAVRTDNKDSNIDALCIILNNVADTIMELRKAVIYLDRRAAKATEQGDKP